MAQVGDGTQADALTVLELLADASPEGAVEALVSAAESEGVTGERLRRLKAAELLAGRVYARFRKAGGRESGLTGLVEFARDMMHAPDLDTLLDLLTARTRQLFRVDLAFVVLVDEKNAGVVRSGDGHTSSALVGFRLFRTSESVYGAALPSAPAWTADRRSDPDFNFDQNTDRLLRQEAVTSLMAIPLSRGGGIVAVLYAAHRTTRHFTVDEVSLAASLGELAMAMYSKLWEHQQLIADFTLTEQFTTRAERALRELTELTTTQDRMVKQLLSGMDLPAFATEIAGKLPGALRIYARDGRVVAQAGDIPGDYDGVVAFAEAWSSREPHMLDKDVWVAPVFAEKEPLGILLIRPDQPLDDRHLRYLPLIAQTAGILLMMFDAKAAALAAQGNELLTDLISGGGHSVDVLGDRAHSLGIDPDRPHVVVATRTVDREVQSFWAAQYARRLGGLSTFFEDATILILPGEDASQAAKAVHDDLVPLAGEGVTVGAAGPARGLESVREVYLEARRCLDAMAALGATGSAGSARDMGFLGLLLSSERDTEGFVRSVLGPVLDYDAQRMTELIPTLEAYYAVGGSPTYAARKLHVHRNTVERRLERISELLGATWQQADRSLEIQLALRIARMREALRR
ncbi:helix-turn-helix domain-containing protein [Streptomyces sp. NPDC004539]|uniref:helix-turn-helix domain-containing protein n=1 Tax=Streptomyces sp. NPDC004539 TaxID=3154280 RepID=UPI0033A2BDAA